MLTWLWKLRDLVYETWVVIEVMAFGLLKKWTRR